MNSFLRIVLNTIIVFVVMFLIFVSTFTKAGVPLDQEIFIDDKGAIIWGNGTITLSDFIIRTDDEPKKWIGFVLPKIDLARLNKINGTKVPLEVYFKTWMIKKYNAQYEERMAKEGVFGQIFALLRGNYVEVQWVRMRDLELYGVLGLIFSFFAAEAIDNYRNPQKSKDGSI